MADAEPLYTTASRALALVMVEALSCDGLLRTAAEEASSARPWVEVQQVSARSWALRLHAWPDLPEEPARRALLIVRACELAFAAARGAGEPRTPSGSAIH